MVAQPEMTGLNFGRITHNFEKTHDGTRYTKGAVLTLKFIGNGAVFSIS
jgi:hypothetical protein